MSKGKEERHRCSGEDGQADIQQRLAAGAPLNFKGVEPTEQRAWKGGWMERLGPGICMDCFCLVGDGADGSIRPDWFYLVERRQGSLF